MTVVADVEAPEGGIPRVQVMGIPICDVDLEGMLARFRREASYRQGSAVFVNAHTLVEAQGDPALRRALRAARFAFADGMPVHALTRAFGGRAQGRVPGPVFMDRALRDPVLGRARHVLFGGTEQTLGRLRERYAEANIVVTLSPPFREWTRGENMEFCEQIRAARPDFVWVGLGAPKQERWLANWAPALGECLALGVGAAFGRNAGEWSPPPEWMAGMGLEWLHRLGQEPRRLAPRYLRTNPMFLAFAALELLRRAGARRVLR